MKRRMGICQQAASVLLLLVVAAGCGGGGGLNAPTGTVSGKVTINGAPLGNAMITFVGENNGDTASAQLASDGSYSLKYGTGFSVPAGDYRVAFSSSNPNAPAPNPSDLMANPDKFKPTTTIPDKYLDAKNSGLIAVVKPGSNSDVNFDLK